jgi:hypothetical protein
MGYLNPTNDIDQAARTLKTSIIKLLRHQSDYNRPMYCPLWGDKSFTMFNPSR